MRDQFFSRATFDHKSVSLGMMIGRGCPPLCPPQIDEELCDVSEAQETARDWGRVFLNLRELGINIGRIRLRR